MSPEASARATGGVLFFTFGGMMMGPAVFGATVAASGSYLPAFAALAAVSLVCGLWLVRPESIHGEVQSV